jgi:hypothetical protein
MRHHDYFLHLSEQYLTLSHTFSHFFRQVNGLLQRAHGLLGRSAFFIPFGMLASRLLGGD